MSGFIAQLFDICFTIFGIKFDIGNIAKTVVDLCKWNKITSTELWSMAKTLNEIFVPIGISLLTMFFMIDLIKKMMEVDRISWERVAMSIVRMLIFKTLILHSYQLLNSIMSIANDSLLTVLNKLGGTTALPSLTKQIADVIDSMDGFLAEVMMAVLVVMLYLPMMGTLIGVIVQILQRLGKLLLSFCTAPIPLGIGVWEDGSGVGKKFIMSVVALGLEAILIVICVYIYSKGIGSLKHANALSTMIGIMTLNGFLLAIISYMNQMAEKLTGGN